MKRRMLALLLSLTLLCVLSACGGESSSPESAPESLREPESSFAAGEALSSGEPSSGEALSSGEASSAEPASSGALSAEEPAASEPGGEEQALIVCFSWTGNTEKVARELQAQTGAALFFLEPEQPYPDDYDELLALAWDEREDGVRPACRALPDLSGCGTIYLGSPVWWDDLPMLVRGFLEEADLSGRTVAPFFTSGGGDAEAAFEAVSDAAPDAAVLPCLSLRSEQAEEASRFVAQWLASLEEAQ